jgi:hypothetical protein
MAHPAARRYQPSTIGDIAKAILALVRFEKGAL